MAKRDIPEINAGSMADIAFLLLIFFLVTTTMDKDQAYIRDIPKKIEIDIPTEPIQKRNICAVKANALNQLMVRGKVMENPDEISDKIIEFYETNELKNDPTNNFPMYSSITLQQIDDQIGAALASAEETENTPGASQDIIDFKYAVVDKWEGKKKALKMTGRSELREIDAQAHVRIEVQQATDYELFTKIHSEIEEAIYTLRDGAAQKLFGESYGVITRRYAQDKETADKDKLDLLKILYPDRFIEVTPKN